ncbi:hypothetical protein PAL_GLEAN10015550 [Pteropus alecto]|uniref:Uncharacterized protein n=1 Tax=Pteropus alecto TaxID=9402 RepID=L5KGG4_PTEAL|nr:hypothetical protein PAL_GLEAN10015550 [Pteropus alecto]
MQSRGRGRRVRLAWQAGAAVPGRKGTCGGAGKGWWPGEGREGEGRTPATCAPHSDAHPPLPQPRP